MSAIDAFGLLGLSVAILMLILAFIGYKLGYMNND